MQCDIPYINDYIDSVEVTYDFPEPNEKCTVKSKLYNKENIDLIKKYCQKRPKFKIFVNVVLHNELDKVVLKKLSKQINTNSGINRICYLRLMPIGKVDMANYPTKLLESSFYEQLKSELTKNNSHVHCALRGVYNKENKCTLAIDKLGISSQGLVYACAWAEHMNKDENNPFYLGDLQESNLADLLTTSIRYKELIDLERSYHCLIFSSLKSPDLNQSKDPLYT